jgi:hypothetical protein
VNTIFRGFEKQTEPAAAPQEAEESPIDNEVNPDGWQW